MQAATSGNDESKLKEHYDGLSLNSDESSPEPRKLSGEESCDSSQDFSA